MGLDAFYSLCRDLAALTTVTIPAGVAGDLASEGKDFTTDTDNPFWATAESLATVYVQYGVTMLPSMLFYYCPSFIGQFN